MQISVKTTAGTQMVDITAEVRAAVRESGIENGLVHVFSMHTTAAVTINENADPAVTTDMLAFINKVVPWDDHLKHMEGNSAAHIKVSLFGPSEIIPLEKGFNGETYSSASSFLSSSGDMVQKDFPSLVNLTLMDFSSLTIPETF